MTGTGTSVSRHRAALLTALVLYCLFLAWVLLWPSAAPAGTMVDLVHRLLLRLGTPEGLIGGARVEFVLNAVMVAPVPFLAALLWPAWTWERWAAYAFLASVAVEACQGVFLAERSAQFPDVVANALGALVGALAATRLVSVTAETEPQR